MTIPALPMTSGLERRLAGRPLVLLLDVDGTLSPIAQRPEYAMVPPPTQRVLTDLTRQPHTKVVLISGRSARDTQRLVGVRDVWVVGNHGIEVAPPNEAPVVRPEVVRFADRIAAAVERCEAIADSAPGVIVEDKRWTLSVHYRLADAAIVPAVSAHVADIAAQLGLRVTLGKEVLELRPPSDVNKGAASLELVESLGASSPAASILCAGDDRTDEDAFRSLRSVHPNAVTVYVAETEGLSETAAEFQVLGTDEFRVVLEKILELRRSLSEN